MQDILVVAPFLKLRPDLYVICMIRDPRDAVVSKHGQDPDVYWAGLSLLEELHPALAPYERTSPFHHRPLRGSRVDPDATQDALMKRMPFLEKRAPFSRYHETAEPSGKSLDALRGVRPIAPMASRHGATTYRVSLANSGSTDRLQMT